MALAAALWACATIASAAPVTHITGAIVQVDANPPGNNNFTTVRDGGQQLFSTASTSFDYNVGGAVNSLAQAQADLAAGRVRARTSLSITNQDDAFSAVAASFIGDSYEHFAGNDPFVWTGATTARFDIRMSGNSSLTGGVRDLFNVGVAFLMIYPKGSLNTDSVPFCGAFQSYFWSIGPSDGLQTPCGGSFLGNFDGAVNRSVSLNFNHPGDFDWVFGIRVGGAASANPNSTVSWINDYFSTAEVFYTPPEGVTSISSGSGTVLSPIPEPSTLALLSLGLCLVAGLACFQNNAPSRHRRMAVALGAALWTCATIASAAPVTHISGAVAQVDANPPGNNNFNIDRELGEQTFASAFSSFSYNVGGAVSSNAEAQADLAAGTVRARSSLTMTNQDDGFVAVATGFIGDSYAHFAGNDPFVWTGATTARFDIRMSGNSSLTGGVRDLFNAGLVFLMIYPKNSLNTDSVPFCGAFQSYFWSIGPSDDRQTPCGGSFLGNFDGNVNRSVSLSFNHPGDFDWVLGIRVGGAVSANPNTTVTWINDYFSTAEVFYTPPEGVTSISSGSGTVLSPVPEPGAAALLSLGLCFVAALARRWGIGPG